MLPTIPTMIPSVIRSGPRARVHPVGATKSAVPSLFIAQESLDGGEQSGDF
jgi:hypothetical protein